MAGRSDENREAPALGQHFKKNWKTKAKRWRCLAIVALLLFMLAMCVVGVFVTYSTLSNSTGGSDRLLIPNPSRLESVPLDDVTGDVGAPGQLPIGFQNAWLRPGSAIGIRSDYLMQNCQGPYLKRSFPDMDYALLGYNLMKGYPLAVGHDPGFTLPIFKADYSAGAMTADCRYSVPGGIVLIPDVSCVTSFSSEIVQTSYELARSLEVSAHVSGGGFGVNFAASAGYKESSSQVSTGESVFILSRASCNYYYMKLLADDAPPFHPVFLKWVVKLNGTERKDVYHEFFELYGTHFLAEVKFGASYTYEHTMSARSFKQATEKGVNVAVSASYSGTVSVGGGFNMAASEKESASDFKKSVTTRTITIGAAPPADGDAMTWASKVQESPVPVSYDLQSIEVLFSQRFMGKGYTARLKIDYDSIKRNIQLHKTTYCDHLKDQGLVDSCEATSPGLIMPRTELYGTSMPDQVIVTSMKRCIDECYKRISCVAVDYCVDCNSKDAAYNTCQLYRETSGITGFESDRFQSMIILQEVDQQFVLNNTAVKGVQRSLDDSERVDTERDCYDSCLKDPYCVAFTFSQRPSQRQMCTLYAKTSLSLFKEGGTSTHFISRRVKDVSEVYPKAR